MGEVYGSSIVICSKNKIILTIKETKQSYAIPVYSPEFIEKVDALDLQFTIYEDLFSEMLLLCIGEITIKYSISQKKLHRNTEENLVKNIENIEKMHHQRPLIKILK